MNIKTFYLTGTLLLLSIGTYAQKKKETINDSNTPLHLLQPEYKVPYKALSTTEVKTDIDRILRYLEKTTHTRVVSEKTGKLSLIIVTCLPMPNWNAAPSAWPVMSGELLIQL